jgi:hypothetical protein
MAGIPGGFSHLRKLVAIAGGFVYWSQKTDGLSKGNGTNYNFQALPRVSHVAR